MAVRKPEPNKAAWRGAGRGGGEADEEKPWLARGQERSRSGGCGEELAAGSGSRGKSLIGLECPFAATGRRFRRRLRVRTRAGGSPERRGEQSLPRFPADGKPVCDPNRGQHGMNAIVKYVPELLGGAADLSDMTKTVIEDSANFHIDPKGTTLFPECANSEMCAIVNGMAAHGGIFPMARRFFAFRMSPNRRSAWPR